MWPEPGSSFEADIMSPAGQVQQRWAFFNGLADLRWNSVPVRFALFAIGLVVLIVIIGSIASSF